MSERASWRAPALSLALGLGLLLLAPAPAGAHCDTLDGPVVADARAALERGDVTPVLKWVRAVDESEVREAFDAALAVRSKGPEAKALADKHFFETLVRVHRAGEGAPYTGLKPAGAELGPAVTGADSALEKGSVDDLVKLITDEAARGVRDRFSEALEKKRHAEESVAAGREYVEAYVEYVHYAERIFEDAARPPTHGGGADGAEGGHGH